MNAAMPSVNIYLNIFKTTLNMKIYRLLFFSSKYTGRRMVMKMIADAANSPNAVRHFAHQNFVGRVVAYEMRRAASVIKMSMSSTVKRLWQQQSMNWMSKNRK